MRELATYALRAFGLLVFVAICCVGAFFIVLDRKRKERQ